MDTLQKRYRNGLDLLIHKDTYYHRPHHLRPILLSDIKYNLHTKHLGRHSIKNYEELEGLEPEQHGIR